MARREATITITAEGRDKGKTFRLTEQPASLAEEWAAQAISGMMAAGVDIPDHISEGGASGLMSLFVSGDPDLPPEVAQARTMAMITFAVRSLAKMPWSVSGPLYHALMQCVMVLPDPRNPASLRAMVETDTEEVATRVKLRVEVLKLHAAFTEAGAP